MKKQQSKNKSVSEKKLNKQVLLTSMVSGKFSKSELNHKAINMRNYTKGFYCDKILTEARFKNAEKKEILTAVKNAQTAFEDFRKIGNKERADFLITIAKEIELSKDKIIATAQAETSLPIARLEGECGRTTNQLRLFAETILKDDFLGLRHDKALPDRKPLPRPDLRMIKVPLGPVAVFGASNFPLAFSVAGGDTASALAAGCPVIVKAHPGHPGTSQLVGEAIIRAIQKHRLSLGIFSLIHSSSAVTARELVTEPNIQAVGFTGSQKVGRILFDLCSSRKQPIPCYAEMGSINPVFTLPSKWSSAPAQFVSSYLQSLLLGCGQFCTNPGVLVMLVPTGLNKEWEVFKAEIKKQLAEAQIPVMLNKLVYEKYLNDRARLMRSSASKIIASSKPNLIKHSPLATLFEVSAKNFIRYSVLQEEVFGPTGVVVVCRQEAELLAVANSLQGQLTATFMVSEGSGKNNDLKQYQKTITELRDILMNKAGRLIMNNFPTGVEVSTAMIHGGPYPATTDSRSTSVGSYAIDRFLRPVCYQNFNKSFLPEKLK